MKTSIERQRSKIQNDKSYKQNFIMSHNGPNPANMATNTTMRKPGGGGAVQPQLSPGGPVANSDIFLFVNAAFRKEFEVCAQLTNECDMVQFEADLIQKLDSGETVAYQTSLRVPRGCMVRAKVHPVFRRLMVQSMWLQQQPAMLRYKGGGQKIDPKDPVCECANPGCSKTAARFVGNPGFFTKKNMLLDPFCVPVCGDTHCVLQAQQMGNKIHAQAGNGANNNAADGGEVNPAISSRGPNSVKSCNVCGSVEQAHGGTAAVLQACPLCGIAYYCSQQCQIQDWQRGHKDVCKPANTAQAQALAKARQAQIEAAKAQQAAAAAAASKPTTIPEASSVGTPVPAPVPAPAPAPAPAPMPMPVRAPAPAPLPKAAPPKTAKKPAGVAMPTYNSPEVSATPGTSSSGAAGGFSMPTYNMPEPEPPTAALVDTSSKSGGGASIPIPTYKMPEPAVQVPPVQEMANLNLGANGTAPLASATTEQEGVKPGRKKAE